MSPIDSLKTENKFKKTEIGQIPVDWEITSIEDVAEIIGGSRPSTKIKEFWDGEIPWAVPTDITSLSGNEINKTERTISEKGLKNCAAKLLPAGSILMTSRATIGECAVNTVPMATSQGFANLICGQHVHNWYIYYLIKSMTQHLERLSSGSTFCELSKKNLRSVKVPCPPFSEQKRIAEILSVVDLAIEKIDAVIAKTKDLKKGLMQHLLTRGIGHKEFKKTKIGRIPETWAVKKIADVCGKPQYGYTASANEKEIGPKLLRITDIQDGGVNWDAVPFCDCPSSVAPSYMLRPGDILFARTGATTGKSFIIGDCPNAVFASYLIRVVVKNVIMPEYLFLIFNSFIYWKQIGQQIGGSAQGGVTASSLAELLVPVPPKEEQEKISTVLSAVSADVERSEKIKTYLESLKQGLMNVLLTGKKRVKS